MKAYSFILYFCCLNFAFSFLGTSIQAGMFCPEMATILSLPYNENLIIAINTFSDAILSFDLSSSGNFASDIFNNASSLLTMSSAAIGAFFMLLGSCLTFLPSLLVFFDVPESIISILSALCVLVFGVGAFQLLTGKWLPFAS